MQSGKKRVEESRAFLCGIGRCLLAFCLVAVYTNNDLYHAVTKQKSVLWMEDRRGMFMSRKMLGKRIVFSVISLVWGFISLDYLYYAFRLLTGAANDSGAYRPQKEGLLQLAGAVMFLLWFFVLAIYRYVIQRNTIQIDLVEKEEKTGKDRIKRKKFDVLLQTGLLITGGLLRWAYLLLIYFPKH